jgi:hypothetical protein
VIFRKTKRCRTCNEKIAQDERVHELQIETTGGLMLLEICTTCADVLEAYTEEQLKPKATE